MPADISDLIGIPFAAGGQGPDAYDCWGLVRELYLRQHGVRIPDFTRPAGLNAEEIAAVMNNQRVNPTWAAVPRQAGAIVLLRVEGVASHVGFMLDEDTFCHTWADSGGVCIARWCDWERRTLGFYVHAD